MGKRIHRWTGICKGYPFDFNFTTSAPLPFLRWTASSWLLPLSKHSLRNWNEYACLGRIMEGLSWREIEYARRDFFFLFHLEETAFG